MARYNTVATVASVSGAGTVVTPNEGLLTTFTGSAPYTVTIASPVLFPGNSQSFFNNNTNAVTLSTPVGAFRGPGSTGAATIVMQPNTVLQLVSNGTDYITVQDDGSAFSATTGDFSGAVGVDGNFDVATTRFTVEASSGNTVVAGTLAVTGTSTFTGAPAFNSTSHMVIPKGTDAQRPGTPATGFMRYNTDRNVVEVWTGSAWQTSGTPRQVDVINTNYSTSAGEQCWVSTSTTAVTITLPGSPVKGDSIRFLDLARSFSARNLTVARNGRPIQGDAQDLTVNTNGAAFDLIYYDGTFGWRIFSI
jgi:hypothetical protein